MQMNALQVCWWTHSWCTPTHFRYAIECTPSALQCTPDILMNALPAHSSALHICKWVHFQHTPSTLLPHLNNCTRTPTHYIIAPALQHALLPVQMHTTNLTFNALGTHSNALVTHSKYTHSNALLFSEGNTVYRSTRPSINQILYSYYVKNVKIRVIWNAIHEFVTKKLMQLWWNLAPHAQSHLCFLSSCAVVSLISTQNPSCVALCNVWFDRFVAWLSKSNVACCDLSQVQCPCV